MPKHPRLIVCGNRYYQSAAVSQDIKETYSKSEETFSLGTSDHQEALRRVRVAAVTIDRKFDDHRRKLKLQSEPLLDVLSDEVIKQVGEIYLSHLLEEDDEIRLEGFEEVDEKTILINESVDANATIAEHGFKANSFEEFSFDVEGLT